MCSVFGGRRHGKKAQESVCVCKNGAGQVGMLGSCGCPLSDQHLQKTIYTCAVKLLLPYCMFTIWPYQICVCVFYILYEKTLFFSIQACWWTFLLYFSCPLVHSRIWYCVQPYMTRSIVSCSYGLPLHARRYLLAFYQVYHTVVGRFESLSLSLSLSLCVSLVVGLRNLAACCCGTWPQHVCVRIVFIYMFILATTP